MPLPVGTPAPDFTLKTLVDGKLADVKLSDSKGAHNVVLLFFPGTFTTPCTQEMCDFSANMNVYSGLGAVVYAVSGDTPFAMNAWAKQSSIGVTLLSDYAREVTKAYEVVNPDFLGMGPGVSRAAFVIDKQGVIRYSEQTPTIGDMPSYVGIKDALASL